jgi:glutathione synthase/RimK-type ligase-like ATP-grasp enzyme/aminoglycoside phosphotransferase (APT) family kinase protein
MSLQISLIFDNPETTEHPIIAVTLQKLSASHHVRLLDVGRLTSSQALAEDQRHPPADLYLLKSHAQQALDVAHALEQRGALVINSWASTLTCQDRGRMAQQMEEARLPWPHTYSYTSLAQLLEQHNLLTTLPFPLIVKSRYSHRGDLVAKVAAVEQLTAFGQQWGQEPVVLQSFLTGDGWDIKFWVIDEQVFAARRRSPLDGGEKKDYPLPVDTLPEEWVRIVREIGRLFKLRLYGVDLLISHQGPVIVDVNSFPGFRGVPGATDALLELVERLGQARRHDTSDGSLGNVPTAPTGLSISKLPSIVTLLFERSHLPLLPGSQGPVDLFVRYLRRKPARGLAVVYNADERRAGRARPHAGIPYHWVGLTLAESALEGTHIRFQSAQLQHAPLHVQAAGILHADELGLSLQAFPMDTALSALPLCCDTAPDGQLFRALEEAARLQLYELSNHLAAARAEPVRYKPASRCVIRYHLSLERLQEGIPFKQTLTIYGKVYADVEQARKVQATMQALYAEQVNSGQQFPLLPRPLGVSDIAGLVFNAAIQPANPAKPGNQLRAGKHCFRAQVTYRRGGEVNRVILAEEELRLTAEILAQLHTSAVQPNDSKIRTGSQEARRVRERAALLAEHDPQQADAVVHLAQRLAEALETLQPENYRPAHGGFKSSQLLFHSHHAFVVDFDGFCLADPALDIGYFLAYLRPCGLWYDRPGNRTWFEASAGLFMHAYRQAMLARGADLQELHGCMARSKLYEGALLFKIASRRVHRLNSPRPKELAAILDEVALCLAGNEETAER